MQMKKVVITCRIIIAFTLITGFNSCGRSGHGDTLFSEQADLFAKDIESHFKVISEAQATREIRGDSLRQLLRFLGR